MNLFTKETYRYRKDDVFLKFILCQPQKTDENVLFKDEKLHPPICQISLTYHELV